MKISGQNGKVNSCGGRIREIRQQKGLSQNALAVKLQLIGLGMTQKTVSRIETGDRVVLDYELKYFAEVLDVTARYLLGLEEREPSLLGAE